MKIQNLLIGGNSFTQDAIGGCPPTLESQGGCSFVDQGQSHVAHPHSWASILAQELAVQSFVNTAAAGHGNILIAQSLRWILKQFSYDRDVTMVMFNVSVPMRLDIPCEFDHPDASPWVHWQQDLVPHTYLNRKSRTHRNIEKQVGLDIVPSLGWAQLDFLAHYLENRGFEYCFLLTENYLDDPDFCDWVEPRQSRMITLDPGVGLTEFARDSGHNTENGYHPDAQGRRIVVDQVREFLSQRFNIRR